MTITTLGKEENPLINLIIEGISAKTTNPFSGLPTLPSPLYYAATVETSNTNTLFESEVSANRLLISYAGNKSTGNYPRFGGNWELSDTRPNSETDQHLTKLLDLQKLIEGGGYRLLNINSLHKRITEHSDESEYQLNNELTSIFRAAEHEVFEYGMESNFINRLASHLENYGFKAIENIARIVLEDRSRPQVIFEVLRWLGSIEHQESRLLRLRLLETCLRNSSRWVRDGAAQGLDDLGDRRAIPHLEEAIRREHIPELRRDLERVLSI